ncbi:MAG: hypothetical protein ACYTBJ_26310 [Planctomycetota bacterium]|jgi:hypothetical protein
MMQINKRVKHHDCCATCAMHQKDGYDFNDKTFWYCLENADLDDPPFEEYPRMRYDHEDDDQYRLKFFMICDSYLKSAKWE